MTEEVIKKLLETNIHLDFMKLIILHNIESGEWKNNKIVYEHYKVLKAKLRPYDECIGYLRKKKKD